MEEFSDDDRSLFIRFTWGRSRLPNIKQWTLPFKVVKKEASLNSLPVSHTYIYY